MRTKVIQRVTRARGFTLIEMMVALVITGLVMTTLYRMLTANQRFYRSQSSILDVQENMRAAAQILPGEFKGLDASGGDIIAMSDTAITIKADRGLRFVCAAPDKTNGYVIVANNTAFGYRAPDATRDSLLIFRDADVRVGTDDSWLHAPIAATASANCTNGTAGTRYTVTGLVGGISKLDSVWVGSPVHYFEVVNYRLYNDGTGVWWLGVRGYTGGTWGSTSPIAGPLRPTTGINFKYWDSTGTITATPAQVAQMRVTVRGLSTQAINIPGRVVAQYADSLSTRIYLRNNARY